MTKPKLVPQYALELVKRLIAVSDTRRIVRAPLKDAEALGFGVDDIVKCVGMLARTDFYRCIASEHDHTLWLDVYHPLYDGLVLYLKLYVETDETIGERVVVLSFKLK
ncbi:MAG TPA: type II toxin-antitoxin system MqsR family toxin [Oscillatoriaceae cyanobacterium]